MLARDYGGRKRHAMVMCACGAPAKCHRHFQIAIGLLRDHGVDAFHVWRTEVVLASELQRAEEDDTDYVYEDLEAFFRK